jgi:preprotein translocase subunit SecB
MARKRDKDETPAKRNGNGGGTPPEATGEGLTAPGQSGRTLAQLNVVGQYIKDLSFECPGVPETLREPPKNPQLQISVNVGATPKGPEIYEVVLNLEAHATAEAGIIYNVELAYGGLFRLRNLPEELLQPVLMIDCPTILFPFLRRVLADLTRDGGFPPLMLDPVDFRRLYAQSLSGAEARPAGN